MTIDVGLDEIVIYSSVASLTVIEKKIYLISNCPYANSTPIKYYCSAKSYALDVTCLLLRL